MPACTVSTGLGSFSALRASQSARRVRSPQVVTERLRVFEVLRVELVDVAALHGVVGVAHVAE